MAHNADRLNTPVWDRLEALAQVDPVVHALVGLKRNTDTPLDEVLMAIVEALAARRNELLDRLVRIAERAPPPSFIIKAPTDDLLRAMREHGVEADEQTIHATLARMLQERRKEQP